MGVIANTYKTYEAKGQREDLSNMIYNISPEETPFMSAIGRGKQSAVKHEWQTDVLTAASSANQQLEGDDVSFDAATPTVRLGNYAEIARKSIIVSGTLEAVDKAGRDSELRYQAALRSAEIKRDMESSILANKVANAGAAGTARATAAILAFIKTNVDEAGDGGSPVYTDIPTGAGADRTDGTQRAFTEAMLKNVSQLCWNEGGQPTLLMVGGFNKTAVSAFTGIADHQIDVSKGSPRTFITSSVDVVVTDFGRLKVIANRFQRSRDALFIDPSMASLTYLRPFQTKKLAPTGDAEKRALLVEFGLKVHNEKAHGIVADLTTA